MAAAAAAPTSSGLRSRTSAGVRSVNPARSLGAAVYAGGEALSQVWLFWVAPILGGIIGGIFGRWLLEDWDANHYQKGGLCRARPSAIWLRGAILPKPRDRNARLPASKPLSFPCTSRRCVRARGRAGAQGIEFAHF